MTCLSELCVVLTLACSVYAPLAQPVPKGALVAACADCDSTRTSTVRQVLLPRVKQLPVRCIAPSGPELGPQTQVRVLKEALR